MMFVPVTNNDFRWEDYSLIIPVISVGNVGQLTADLIISTLCMDRIGYIMHDAITPAVGNNPFADPEDMSCRLTTCCEVYKNADKRIVIIQQRAPLIKGRSKSFVRCLSEWIRDKHFLHVLIISGTFSHERLDQQLEGSPFRVVKTKKMEEKAGNVFSETLGWRDLELRSSLPDMMDVSSGADSISLSTTFYMPGSGIAKPLFESLNDLPVLLLLMFCSEGDNALDAVDFANQLNAWMTLVLPKLQEKRQESLKSANGAEGRVQWKIPTSWKHVYGSYYDRTLFH